MREISCLLSIRTEVAEARSSSGKSDLVVLDVDPKPHDEKTAADVDRIPILSRHRLLSFPESAHRWAT